MKKPPFSFRQAALKALLFSLILLSLPLSLSCSAADRQEPLGGENSSLINILLVGQDRREPEEAARADSVILCSFRPDTNTVTITSFLRDLYVQIPGHEANRLNAAYACGGMPLLKQTLLENLDIHIDGTIDVDFSQFSGIIDTLGGVSLELRQDEAELINKTVPGDLSEGIQQLTGEQALAYSRIRRLDADGDFSRSARQRKLLSSLLDSYRDTGLLKILSAIADTLPLISTDLSKKQVFLLAAKLFPMLDDPVIVSQRIPADGAYQYSTIRGMEVLTTDLDEAKQQLRRSLLPPEDGSEGSVSLPE